MVKPILPKKKDIKERFEDYYLENFIIPQEEQEAMKRFGELQKEFEIKKYNAMEKFAKKYLSENNPEICKKCHLRDCLLLNEMFGCSYIGKKIKEINEKTSWNPFHIEFAIVNIPLGVWGEVFHPYTKEEINKIERII